MDTENVNRIQKLDLVFTDRFHKNLMSLPTKEGEKICRVLEKYKKGITKLEKINTVPNLYQITAGRYRVIVHRLPDEGIYILSSIINRENIRGK